MSLFDDDQAPLRLAHAIGADLTLMSAEELDERIAQLRAEIERLERERERKTASRAAAEQFFR